MSHPVVDRDIAMRAKLKSEHKISRKQIFNYFIDTLPDTHCRPNRAGATDTTTIPTLLIVIKTSLRGGRCHGSLQGRTIYVFYLQSQK